MLESNSSNMRERFTTRRREKLFFSMPDKCIPDKVSTNGDLVSVALCPREHLQGDRSTIPLRRFRSLKYGEIAGNNPWQATGLEWQIQSPPLTENFIEVPIVDHEAYDYEWLAHKTGPR